MNYKWLGAILIVSGCAGWGFSLATSQARQEKYLRQLLQILENMETELKYRLTPLPDLCRQAGNTVSGVLKDIFHMLAEKLDMQIAPDVSSCLNAVIEKKRGIPIQLLPHLLSLGRTLGRFDLEGQIRGIQAVKEGCQLDLDPLEQGREERLRSYRTVGICAGIALAVVLA